MTWFEAMAAYAQANLTERVREELYGRGVTDEQISLYGLGYVNGSYPTEGVPSDFGPWCKDGEKLRDVIVLPLTTPTGAIRGFQFRQVDREKKGYQTYMPYKEEALLFGLGQAMPHVWATQSIWLVEGAFDLFPLQRHFPGIVATLTAKVPEPLVRVMRRLVRTVWVGYDADPTGKSATKQFEREFRSEFQVRPVYYPSVRAFGSDRPIKDPGELWEAWGDEQMGNFVRSLVGSVDPMEFADGQDVFHR